MRLQTLPQILLLCLALAGCAAAQASSGRPAGGDEWWNDGTPMDKQKASTICWMKYEKGNGDLPLDKRADLVNKCVHDTMAGKPVQ
jgi:hypothetical protein